MSCKEVNKETITLTMPIPHRSGYATILQGDSGGPLNCQGRDGKWYVQGVTSFVDGRGCNTFQRPTVFTRVSTFISWISKVEQSQIMAITSCYVNKTELGELEMMQTFALSFSTTDYGPELKRHPSTQQFN